MKTMIIVVLFVLLVVTNISPIKSLIGKPFKLEPIFTTVTVHLRDGISNKYRFIEPCVKRIDDGMLIYDKATCSEVIYIGQKDFTYIVERRGNGLAPRGSTAISYSTYRQDEYGASNVLRFEVLGR